MVFDASDTIFRASSTLSLRCAWLVWAPMWQVATVTPFGRDASAFSHSSTGGLSWETSSPATGSLASRNEFLTNCSSPIFPFRVFFQQDPLLLLPIRFPFLEY